MGASLTPDSHLYVGVQQHQSPLAVAAVNAQGQLHLLKQQYGHTDTLLLVVSGGGGVRTAPPPTSRILPHSWGSVHPCTQPGDPQCSHPALMLSANLAVGEHTVHLPIHPSIHPSIFPAIYSPPYVPPVIHLSLPPLPPATDPPFHPPILPSIPPFHHPSTHRPLLSIICLSINVYGCPQHGGHRALH